MIQPARVLPSNAPPLREVEEVQHVSRVLQEHSGNRQQSDFKFNPHEQHGYLAEQHKYHGPVLSENVYPQHHHHQQQQQQSQQLSLPPASSQAYQQVPALYHPQPQHRHPFRYGYYRSGFRHPQDQERIHIEADRLFHRFRLSDQYVKYRSRQSKDGKANDEQKWPDELEKAFFRALVQWPPMGRRKLLHKDKQRGRNELISDGIEELTGVYRSRKQVSSHIQVLKPFVEQDPLIMKWLSKDDMCVQPGRYHGHPVGFASGRRLSNFPVHAPPPMVCTALPTVQRPENPDHELQRLKNSLDAFEPLDFQMFVQRRIKTATSEDTTERLHIYTQSPPNPLGTDLPLNDWRTIERDFPFLSLMNTQRPLDCTVLVAEASLALNVEKWNPREGVELGIWFLCSSRHFPPTPPDTRSQVRVNNTFYEHDNCIKSESGTVDVEFYRPVERGGAVSGLVETHIKFGSSFWARVLGTLGNRHREAVEGSQQQKDDVAASIRGITAVQEVFVCSDTGFERILVIHWKFRQSSCPRGRASWRKLILPSPNTPYVDSAKTERVDSLYEYELHSAVEAAAPPHPPSSQQTYPQPALQSPFEYNDTTSSSSGISATTWPTTLSDSSTHAAAAHDPLSAADGSFDFNNLNVGAYYPNFNFDGFDSSAFNFDSTGVAGPDFVASDPALQQYSQTWCDSSYGTASFDSQATQPVDFGAAAASQVSLQQHHQGLEDTQSHLYAGFQGHYEQQHMYVPPGGEQQQAYGGAGPEMIKEEDALAALADASSYLARSMQTN